MSVGIAISGVIFSPRSAKSHGAASNEGLRAEAATLGSPGARAGPDCRGMVGAGVRHGGPARRADPPPPELPNKFELAKFEEPAHPDYTLAEATRIETEAIGADGPAPRMPERTSQTAERQVLEESGLTPDPTRLPEVWAAEAPE